MTIRSNGTVTAGPFVGHWRLVDSAQRVYNIAWPEAVDNVVVAGDERSLSGGNQYGFFVTSYRTTYGSGIVGTWRWPNGKIVVIRLDGTFAVGNISGRWKITSSAARTYALTWPKPVDTATLSADHLRLSGVNQFEILLSATRSPAACEVK